MLSQMALGSLPSLATSLGVRSLCLMMRSKSLPLAHTGSSLTCSPKSTSTVMVPILCSSTSRKSRRGHWEISSNGTSASLLLTRMASQ